MDKLSYAFAFGVANQFKQMRLENRLVIEDFADGLRTLLKGEKPSMEISEVEKVITAYLKELETETAKEAEVTKQKGEEFLKENAKRENITVTATGLQYEVITEGDGKSPKGNDTVVCHYEGRLINGTVFDSSYRRGEPATFNLGQVIKGWTEGVQLMKVGSKYRFFIPSDLGYGDIGAGEVIPGGSTLIFEVELLAINN